MSSKNYGLSGVSANVEFAKNGLKIKSNGTAFQAYNNAEDTLVALQVADGSNAADAVNKGQLDTKQGTLTVAAGSAGYLDITNDEISVKNLLVHDVTVDVTHATITLFCASEYTVGTEFQEGDLVVLTTAAEGPESWIHNGGTAVTEADFTKISVNITDSVIRGLFSGGTGIAYNSSTGEIVVDATSAEISDAGSYTNITGSDVAALLASIDTVLGGILTDVTNLQTLSGVADGSTDLGTFTGSTIADSSTIKSALQSLETGLEATVASTFGERHVMLQYTDAGNNNVGTTIPDGAMITDWYVDVRTAFDDVDATLEVGIGGNLNSVLATTENDLQEGTMFVGHPHTGHTSGATQFIANLVPDGSTQGEVCIVLKYIIMG
jgi:hypothetical protein